jgi:hypothetical protein
MAAQLAIRLVVGVVGVVAGGRILLRLNCISNSFIPFQDWSQSYTVHDLHDVHDRFWVTHVHDGGLIQFTQISGAFFFLRCVLGGVSAMVMRRCFGPLGLWGLLLAMDMLWNRNFRTSPEQKGCSDLII